uniref:Uncharacterized protein n=1 Tax=Aegilops tauschii subsp. strangulata TaxID=200361 RepID=A0A453E395_AEGTS
MRREGRQRGWVRVYDRALVDPEGKRRAVHVVDGPVVANGGFIRAPRKPTNQSKSGGLRALGTRSGGRGASCKGSRKFKHSEIKMYYVDAADDVDGRLDYLCDFDS